MLRFLLLMACVMAVDTSVAGDVSRCPVDAVPIQGIRFALPDHLLSSRGFMEYIAVQHAVTTLSGFKETSGSRESRPSSREQFHDFVEAVTEHVATRLAEDNLCTDSAESRERSLLQFVNWPLSRQETEHLVPVLPLDVQKTSSSGCRIFSPWIDLAFERKPVPWIRAIVRWNQRQVLADRSELIGVKNVPPGVAKPLVHGEYGRFVGFYKRVEEPRKFADFAVRNGLKITPELAEQVDKAKSITIEEHVPPDILFMFRQGVYDSEIRMNGKEGYTTKLIIALIDRCFASEGADLHYNSILDVADLVSLEQHKIKVRTR
ncbi:MAG: hypothetical protein LBQ75_01895 [Zoogloeaceae bacterium]|jgi:hypothetical protein|nr:hypothetical protein [Zoogloeaceae bacterium]